MRHEKTFPKMVSAVPDARDGALVFRKTVAGEGQGFCVHPIWRAARHGEWPRAAAGFARAECAAATARKIYAQSGAVERDRKSVV